MNLLIVDDEISSLISVSNMINKEKLLISQCFKAENVQEAKNCLLSEPIDIVLCDIEMPQESGLELLEWIGKEQLPVECIIMTCHAEFEYARRAVSLGSVAYLLKPIDPEELERELLNAIQIKETKKQLKEYSHSWIRNQDVIRGKFWSLLFQGEILSDITSIQHWLYKKSIDIHTEWEYCPILFVTRQWNADIVAKDYNLFRFALKNILAELFLEKFSFPMCDIVQFENDVQLVVIGADCISPEMNEAVKKICSEYMLNVKEYFSIKINCYIGKDVEIQEIANEIESLYQMDINNLWNEGIYERRKYNKMISSEQLIFDFKEFDHWLNQLINGEFAEVEKSIYKYLEYQTEVITVNRKWLSSFHQQYMIMLGSYAVIKKYYLNQIMETREDLYFSLTEYSNGIEEVKKLISFSIKALYQFEQQKLHSSNPVEITKTYITEHLAEKLDMDTLSQNVHLNSDYLTRIFRHTTGEPINKYIVNQRIKKAKKLLEFTNDPISEIAFQVGYFNYISFNRIFTKTEGVSPQTYRQNSRNNNSGRIGKI